jgi:IS4 transposase
VGDPPFTRRPTALGPLPGDTGWLALEDDDLVFRIESLPPDHDHDDELVAVVRSTRHFFIRQEAAKRIRDAERLKAFATDRHIGQILARQMRRESDVDYLEQLVRESRYLEVRNAAEIQLRLLKKALGRGE